MMMTYQKFMEYIKKISFKNLFFFIYFIMKKILFLLFIFVIFITNVKASYVIINQDNGDVIKQSNMNEKRLIASITKVMTAYIIVNNLNMNDLITVGDEIDKAHGSSIYLTKGETLTVQDLLYGLMLRSGNDAATVLAKYESGSVDEFVKKMNQVANEIGMKNTLFQNPTGLDDDGTENISTAYDMAILTKKAMENKMFRKVFKTKKYSCKSNKKSYIWYNKNKALSMSKYVTGGKTGYTKKSKRTLITTASKNNINLIVVTLNMSDDFNFHVNTYNDIFKKYHKYLIINKYDLGIQDKYYSKKENIDFYTKNNYYILSKINNLRNISIKYQLYKIKNIHNHDVVGKALVYQKNKIIHEEPIYIILEKEYVK